MLLPTRTTITIETGENYFTAIFKRQYVLVVLSQHEGRAIINVTFQDYVPSGYLDGNSDGSGFVLECKEIKIPTAKNMTARKWLAKLVNQHHSDLLLRRGCQYANKSRQSIQDQLAQIR